MSARNFKFVSPGVVMEEIDRSVTAGDITADPGPVIIGRSATGPSMRPVQVNSYTDFIELFGNPVAGHSTPDTWRDGNYSSPTYAAYAAQAFLRSDAAPITFIRTLGLQSANAATGGEAGWTTANSAHGTTLADDGGAYGLFVMESGSAEMTATLAAVLYINEGTPILKGTFLSSSSTLATSGSLGLCKNETDDALGFRLMIMGVDSGGTEETKEDVVISLNSGKGNFIRNVLNTSPLVVNSATTTADNLKTYWLGETYEESLAHLVSSDNYATLVPLTDGTTGREDMQRDFTHASTGWFISQDLTSNHTAYLPASMQKLFKIEALDAGEWSQNNIKVSIENLASSADSTLTDDPKSGYGTFTLVVRSASDTDNAQERLEVFTNLSLNPASPDYIARRIGDATSTWQQLEKRFVPGGGDYDNISKYIRVVTNDNGTGDARNLPYGIIGPAKLKDGSADETSFAAGTLLAGTGYTSGDVPFPGAGGSTGLRIDSSAESVTFKFADMPLVTSSAGAEIEDTYFGASFSAGFGDYLRALPTGASALTTHQWAFSLDDVVLSTTDGIETAAYAAGNRVGGSQDWKAVIDNGTVNFTAPLHGGFNGEDITELDPYRNELLTTATEINSYAFNTIQQAINMIKDPEVVEMNLATIPGITNASLTGRLVDVCEQRADALAIIDLPNLYYPRAELALYADASKRVGSSPDLIASAAKTENRDSSYGCTYAPWVKIYDSLNDQSVWVPPSVVALGTMGSSEAASAVWFAPAGFNRGGLTEGSAGLPVTAVSQKLTSKERDALYDARINPIASFPAEGIVVFGQKTLQIKSSALNRINVRRMLNHVKKEISKIANSTLFEQNIQSTWTNFTAKADPFLSSVQSGFGLQEYKLVLDETTTTPDLVDRNIMYAKVYLKPARAIEFIALDFIITNSGASFDD